jgi:hypothetical protein
LPLFAPSVPRARVAHFTYFIIFFKKKIEKEETNKEILPFGNAK